LEQARADSKRYPAVDPIESYSKYIEYPELISYLDENVQKDWAKGVQTLKDVLLRGKEAKDQINILGDDGVPIEYHVIYNKSEVVDFSILQQDSFDKVDGTTPMPRQKHLTNTVLNVCKSDYGFDDFDEVSKFFRKVINLINQMKYTQFESQEFYAAEKELREFVATKAITSNKKESA
jgi:V/A-type H+-transporting ATPase subunit A